MTSVNGWPPAAKRSSAPMDGSDMEAFAGTTTMRSVGSGSHASWPTAPTRVNAISWYPKHFFVFVVEGLGAVPPPGVRVVRVAGFGVGVDLRSQRVIFGVPGIGAGGALRLPSGTLLFGALGHLLAAGRAVDGAGVHREPTLPRQVGRDARGQELVDDLLEGLLTLHAGWVVQVRPALGRVGVLALDGLHD